MYIFLEIFKTLSLLATSLCRLSRHLNQSSKIMLGKNLKYLRAKLNMTQDEIADKLGCKRSAYKEYEYERTPPIDVLIKLSSVFEVSLDDLVKSNMEEMSKLSLNKQSEHSNGLSNLKVLAITVDHDDREYIQFVPEKAKAGYLTGYANPSFVGTLPQFRLPNLPVGTYRAFEISGDSMPPVSQGSIVIGKYVENFNYVNNLCTYILVTKEDGFSYKRIINKAKKGFLICLSDNAHYQPYTINTEEILEMWSYYCHIDFRGQETPNKTVLNELMKMSDDVNNLEDIVTGKLIKAEEQPWN
jgi:transcriptional regulator with XRE-family HTH domain